MSALRLETMPSSSSTVLPNSIATNAMISQLQANVMLHISNQAMPSQPMQIEVCFIT